MKRSCDKTDSGRYVAITPELQAMAEVIRQTFLDVRQNYSGVPVPKKKPADGPYLRAALLCRELKLDPVAFVMRQTEEMAKIGRFFPNFLHSRKFALAAQMNTIPKDLHCLGLYRFQLELLKERVKLWSVKTALQDSNNGFSPLFICCIANRNGLSEITEPYRANARLELASNPIAREIFGAEVDLI